MRDSEKTLAPIEGAFVMLQKTKVEIEEKANENCNESCNNKLNTSME